MVRIVFCDIDGTILDSDHRLSERTIMAVRALEKNGVPFVLVSARGPACIEPVRAEGGFSGPVISYSGALVQDDEGRILFENSMTGDESRRIVEYVENRHPDTAWSIYTAEDWIVKDRSDSRVVFEEEVVKVRATEGSSCSVPDGICKIMLMCHAGRAVVVENDLKSVFPAYSIVRSSDTYIEIMKNGVSKAEGVRTLSSILSIPLSDAAAFGDSYVDIGMIEEVGYGFLMGNAPEDLRRRYPHHAPDNDHDGVAAKLGELGVIPVQG